MERRINKVTPEPDDEARLRENKLDRTEIFSGKVLHIVKDSVVLPNGEISFREVALHRGAVCIVPITERNGILLERQFRYPFDRVIWEIPAGKLDTANEDPLEAAKRELSEETGYSAEEYRFIGEYYSSPAILSEKIYMYVATGLKAGERRLDDDEFLDVIEIPFGEVVKMIAENEIPDGKTQTAVLKAKLLLGV